MVPSVISLRIHTDEGRKLRLWLPVFILWPFGLILFALIAPFLALAEAILIYRGTPIRLFGILGGVLSVLCSLRGTSVNVKGRGKGNDVMVRIY
jgi:hypothetical protein